MFNILNGKSRPHTLHLVVLFKQQNTNIFITIDKVGSLGVGIVLFFFFFFLYMWVLILPLSGLLLRFFFSREKSLYKT